MTKQQTKTRETNQTNTRNPETSPARDKGKPEGNKNRQAQQGIQAKTREF
jgi:hypothetical protein